MSAWWLTLALVAVPGVGLIPGQMFWFRLAVQIVGFVFVALLLAPPSPLTSLYLFAIYPHLTG